MSSSEHLPDRWTLLGLGLTGLCGAGLIVLDAVERFATWSLAEGGLLLDEVVGIAVLLPLVLLLLRGRRPAQAPAPSPDVAELTLSRDRYRDFARASCDWMWEMDAELRLSLVDEDAPPSAQRLVSLFEEGILSQPDQVKVDPETWQRQWTDITRRKPFRGLRFNILDANGESQWLELNGTPVLGPNGQFHVWTAPALQEL